MWQSLHSRRSGIALAHLSRIIVAGSIFPSR
jgi:hypothetical protein